MSIKFSHEEVENLFRAIFEKSPYPMALTEIDTGCLVDINLIFCKMVKLDKVDLIGRSTTELGFYSKEDRKIFMARLCSHGKVRDLEMPFRAGNQVLLTNMHADYITFNDTKYILTTFENITERKKAEAALLKSEEIFSKFMEYSPIYVFFKDENLRSLRLSANYESMLGKPIDELLGKSMEELFPGELARSMIEDDQKILREGKPVEVEEELDGRHYHTIKFPVWSNGRPRYLAGFTMDITPRKKAETEREKMQAQLTQAQKMESVGRLAGGVAHDFNNMLTIILGYTQMAMKKIPPSDPLQHHLDHIHTAARKSTDITRQLLAFARRQAIDPRVLDFNQTIEHMFKMLRRLIGEDVTLSWLPGSGLWPVRADPTQIDQILANLCVNARDAVSGNGKIIMETGNVTFDQAYCNIHPGFVPGDFVLLAVSDTGHGMDKATMDRIFEPFFTTRDIGQGTGLGLATVYGIVKQNDGFINVYSEKGAGTTIKIYLPRHQGVVESPEEKVDDGIPQGRSDETILIVEDDRDILMLTKEILEISGYSVLTASSPSHALKLAQENAGKIQLLLTDVIMPEMNGRDLADRIVNYCPGLKVLFMSGYTTNVIVHQGILETGVEFIQKPFGNNELHNRIQKMLSEK